jgi:hypothetical protein
MPDNAIHVLVIDDYHPDPTQRPFLLFGPFTDWDAAQQWALAHDSQYNDWQVVTVPDIPRFLQAGKAVAAVPVYSPEEMEAHWPLHPVPPMDPALLAQIEQVARQQAEERGEN